MTTTGSEMTGENGETILLVNDAPTTVSISKWDVTNDKELPGATIQILDDKGNVAKDLDDKDVEWVSTDEPHIVYGLKTGVTYTLHETVAPKGYTVATDTTFTIDADGTVKVISASSVDQDGKTVLLVEDAQTLVKVTKADTGAGKELPGAQIVITDSEGNIKDQWTSARRNY